MNWIKKKTLAIDIGNSRIKLLDDDIFSVYELHYDDWLKKLEKTVFADIDYKFIVVSSVNQEAYSSLIKLLKEKNVPFSNASDIIEKSNIISFSRVEGMGIDRRLGLIATVDEFSPPLVTVDCGTAITINILVEPNIALGGAIFPGLRTQAKALEQFTSLLPLVDTVKPASIYGTNTVEAIQIGIFNSVIGGIKEVITNLSRKKLKRQKPTVVVTGGDGALIAENLSGFDVHFEPNLVLKGLQKLAKSVKNF